MNIRISLISFCLWMVIGMVYGQSTVSITQFGGQPDSRKDVVPALNKALASCKGKSGATITFPRGRYDFFPSAKSNTGIAMSDLNGITIDGQGSEFVFHGNMKVSVIKRCSNITLQHFSVDWDRPFMSQGEIVKVRSNYTDIHIDRTQYPYEVRDGRIMFKVEDEEYPASSQFNNLYYPDTKEIVFDTRDAPLGSIFEQRAKQLKNDVVRFYGTTHVIPEEGMIVAIRHMKYHEYGFDIQDCRDMLFRDIQVHHATSQAFHAEHSENITLDNASALCNSKKGRVFSSVTDNAHFVNCRGLIRLINCDQNGAGDDFLNIHGRYFKILEKRGSNTVVVESTDVGIAAGEEMWMMKSSDFSKSDVMTVLSCKTLQPQERKKRFEVTFHQSIPREIGTGDLLESKTWVANVEIRNCKITRRHRARGILVTTPGRVVIENNTFSCAGAAIVIEGDTKHWYESGAVENVTIRNNTFDNCFTSGNSNGKNGNWGNAIISITPSYQPSTLQNRPYHHNISITGNTFRVFDAPILFARAVEGLIYENNRVIQSEQYPQYTWQRSAFLLDGCRRVRINNNHWDHNYPYKEVRFMHMQKTDIISGEQQLKTSLAGKEGR